MFKYAPKKRVILSDFSGYISQAVARSLHQYRLNFSGFPEIALKRGGGQIEVSLNLEGTGIRALVVTEKDALMLAKRFRDRRPVDFETLTKVKNALKSLEFQLTGDRKLSKKIAKHQEPNNLLEESA